MRVSSMRRKMAAAGEEGRLCSCPSACSSCTRRFTFTRDAPSLLPAISCRKLWPGYRSSSPAMSAFLKLRPLILSAYPAQTASSGSHPLLSATSSCPCGSGEEATGGDCGEEGRRERKEERGASLKKKLIGAYEELYKCSYSDTKSLVLSSLHQLLSSYGMNIQSAWPSVFHFLPLVAKEAESQQVRQGTTCMAYMCEHLLLSLSLADVDLLLEILLLFCSQDVDSESSLKSIGLTRDVGRHLMAKLCLQEVEEGREEEEERG
uniref:Mon2/Sec7/BIG1-like HDS domain-containing protein n=1 Tax=Hanusia phi TaxID=3032 RepID=A0A7S0EIT1_9CRYP|mmetsp:Transcript_2547/g.6122  ORF Transcript_2547/g.6122 Transcript_2547/m.6122 type:complete len:263 (+) Transcript_2547:221-1009(+)